MFYLISINIIFFHFSADGDFIVTTMTKAVLHSDGRVVWTPPVIFSSSCEIDVEFFPFDEQACFLKLGSWTHDGYQVSMKNISDKLPAILGYILFKIMSITILLPLSLCSNLILWYMCCI